MDDKNVYNNAIEFLFFSLTQEEKGRRVQKVADLKNIVPGCQETLTGEVSKISKYQFQSALLFKK